MARWGRFTRRPRAPKPPKQPKIKRPLVRDLRQAYKNMLTTDIGQRIASLNIIMQWFDQYGLPYVMFKNKGTYSVDQAKMVDKACKCRDLGMSTHSNEEKETAYRRAVILYEKAVEGTLEVPKIEPVIKQLEAQAGMLELRRAQMELKHGRITDLLTKALAPTNITGQAIELKVGQVTDPYRMDPERSQLTLRRDVAKSLAKRLFREGLLPVFREVVEPLARMAALKSEVDGQGNPTGKYIMEHKEHKAKMMEMLDNLIEFAKTPEAPKRMVKALSLTPKQPKVGVPGKAVGGGLARGPRLAGTFVAGTAQAWLWQQLLDGKDHPLLELQKGLPASAKVHQRLKSVDEAGRMRSAASGDGWTIEINGDAARVVFSSPTYQKQLQDEAKAVKP